MARDRGPTQAELLLDLLRERGSAGVTPLLALDRIGSFRLGARIFDLRAEGHNISRRMVATAGGAHVACYVLEPGPRPDPTLARGQVELPW
jgi:hypothetical protein